MSAPSESLPRTMWLPVPVLAVPVKVTLDAASGLDDLAKTILRHATIRPRPSVDLSERVGLPVDLVDAVLAELMDRGLVGISNGVFAAAAGTASRLYEGEVHAGWAFIVPRSEPDIVPRLWIGADPPPATPRSSPTESQFEIAGDFSDVVRDYLHESRPAGPDDVTLSQLLRKLVGSTEVEAYPWPPERSSVGFESDRDSPGEPLDLPDLGSSLQRPRVMGLDVDQHARSVGHRFRYTVLWSQVDFLPRIAGPAATLFHEPELAPSHFGPRPITNLVRPWLSGESKLQELVKHVDQHADAMREEFSIVLKLAGIKDAASLEKEVDAHQARLERTGGTTPSDRELWGNVMDEMRDAWRWTVIAQREPAHLNVARDRYAHAVEDLIQALRDLALPHLRVWSETFEKLDDADRKRQQKERSNNGWFRDRCGLVGLGQDLGPSAEHLVGALGALRKLPNEIAGTHQQSAGANITLWLLPIFLLDDEDAKAFAAPIEAATDRMPLLLTALDELRELRNATFHKRADVPDLERAGRKLFEVWASLASGYDAREFRVVGQ